MAQTKYHSHRQYKKGIGSTLTVNNKPDQWQRDLYHIFLLQMKGNQFMDDEEYNAGGGWNINNLLSDLEEAHDLNILAYSQPNSVVDSERKPQTSNKNKYIKKIGELKPNETISTQKIQPSLSNLDLPPEQLKKRKNRQAARGSRQRKKEYIKLIEEHTKTLQQSISNTEREIDAFKIEIQKSIFNNNQSIGVVDSKLAQIHKKIERILTTQDDQEKNIQLNLALDSLIYRFGISGKQRRHNINEGYRLTLSIVLPLISRYFLWAAKQRQHIYASPGLSAHEEWFADIRSVLQPNLKDHLQMLVGKRDCVAKIQQKYRQLILKLKQVKGQIQKVAACFEDQFVEIRDAVTPVQCAKLIFFIQKCKYRPEIKCLIKGKLKSFSQLLFAQRNI